jgi:hypothetical protein
VDLNPCHQQRLRTVAGSRGAGASGVDRSWTGSPANPSAASAIRAITRAIGAASACAAGERASRNAYVIGSIPVGGSAKLQVKGPFLHTRMITSPGSGDRVTRSTKAGSQDRRIVARLRRRWSCPGSGAPVLTRWLRLSTAELRPGRYCYSEPPVMWPEARFLQRRALHLHWPTALP